MSRKTCAIGLLSLISLNLITGCDNQVADTKYSIEDFRPANWPRTCQQIKQVLEKSPGDRIIYQNRPQNHNIQSSWEFNWLGERLPIPALQYQHVAVSSSQKVNGDSDKNAYSVKLSGELKGKTVLVSIERGNVLTQPMDDVFSAVVDGVKPSEEGKTLTKQFFGGPVTMVHLMSQSYNYQSSDFTCNRSQWEKEVPIAIRLGGKSSRNDTNDNDIAAYKLDQGLVSLSNRNNNERWRSLWEDKNMYNSVILELPTGHNYGKIGLGVKQSNWKSAPDSPKWLNTLATALKHPKPSNWEALAQDFEAAKLSEESIASAKRMAVKAQ
ncbi:hypothetical protein IQ266_04840 [filamentous cyanobacterium LEGE 11480]|uniref:Lipoprotein n=1 Tax=Romeriopsis navalis LEGE 11480 TaxID=2777977 RepID=A0A928Z2I5_9CYAN|nr:hypothetical protein [Romeriopsis navalis]MBE9029087.1 hypothetical protein [Romeriopsis navalis LEGE 11480]